MPPQEFLQGQQPTVEPPERISFEEFSGGESVNVFKPETEDEKLSFAQRFGEDLEKRRALAGEISDAVTSGEQSFAEGVLQIAGKVGVMGTFDLIGQGLVSAFRALPDFIEKPIRTASSFLLETDLGKSGLNKIEQGVEAYNEFKEANPRFARNLEAIIDIGLIFAPVRPKVKTPPTRAGVIGARLEERAVTQVLEKRGTFIERLVRPEPTKAVREAEVRRTAERGIFKTKEVAPSKTEVAIANEVAKIEGVTSSKTLQGNYNAINKENVTLAKQLEADILKNDFVYPKKQLLAELNNTKARLAENPLIVGDAEKVASKLLDKFEKFIQAETGKGSGILSARKKFDAWVKNQKGTNVFDPKNENALSIALREIRKTANDFLEKNAVNVEVKNSLKKQSTLFRALDNITPKAATEGANIAIRAWQNVLQVLPFRGEFNQIMAVLFGLGGLGASAVFAPFFTKIVLGTLFVYGASRVVMGSGSKKALSHLLKGVDGALRKTKDVNLIRELRADRAAVLELLEVAGESVDSTSEGEVE